MINIEQFANKLPKDGEKRLEVGRHYGVGRVLRRNTDGYVLTVPITMDVTWRFSDGDWYINEEHWDTIQPVLSLWQKFKAWLFRKPVTLPEATLVKE